MRQKIWNVAVVILNMFSDNGPRLEASLLQEFQGLFGILVFGLHRGTVSNINI